MKQLLEIYLHGPGTTEEKVIKVPEDASVEDVIEAAIQAGVITDARTLVTVEDEEEPLQKGAVLRDCGVKHKHHLHCHTCEKIKVVVHFNGQSHQHKFAPGRKVKKVLKWSLDAFGLTGVDAENKELRLGGPDGTVLISQNHIGSYVKRGQCELELYLTGIVEVNG